MSVPGEQEWISNIIQAVTVQNITPVATSTFTSRLLLAIRTLLWSTQNRVTVAQARQNILEKSMPNFQTSFDLLAVICVNCVVCCWCIWVHPVKWHSHQSRNKHARIDYLQCGSLLYKNVQYLHSHYGDRWLRWTSAQDPDSCSKVWKCSLVLVKQDSLWKRRCPLKINLCCFCCSENDLVSTCPALNQLEIDGHIHVKLLWTKWSVGNNDSGVDSIHRWRAAIEGKLHTLITL